jgi:hypothetical protein
MKQLFYLGILGIILYEIAKVYFIMPMPGSQQMNSVDLAYFLHTWRWAFRILLWGLVAFGLMAVLRSKRKWIPVACLLLALALTYVANFQMAADTMFYQPQTLSLLKSTQNKVPQERLVLGVALNGEAKAYPIQFIGYHHQVQDVLGGKPILVTYCTVCRTGRVFEPRVNDKHVHFRLVGMDHFNAMFEDEDTHSWWRQVNGEALTGPLKGKVLPELASTQMTLAKWLELYPQSKIMQADPEYLSQYDSTAKYENGESKSELTKTDPTSWQEKSWVVGITKGGHSRAFDWNQLKTERVINSAVGSDPVLLVLASDDKSFFAFERAVDEAYVIRNDTLLRGATAFSLLGKGLTDPALNLKPIPAYQEYWHSWRTFHPNTKKY